MNETWKDIPGYEGAYQVSDLGRVLSLGRVDGAGVRRERRILKARFDSGGRYLRVVLCPRPKKCFAVHRLVLGVFTARFPLPPRSEGEVNHKDGDRANNALSNLEWVTASQNSKHSWRVLETRAKPVIGVPVNGGQQLRFATQTQAAEAFGVSPGAIAHAVKGRNKSSAGHRWRFA